MLHLCNSCYLAGSTNVCRGMWLTILVEDEIATTAWPTKALNKGQVVVVDLPRINTSYQLTELIQAGLGWHCVADVILVPARLDQVKSTFGTCGCVQGFLCGCFFHRDYIKGIGWTRQPKCLKK